MSEKNTKQSLSIQAAQKLSTTTKTQPQMGSITPRWLLKLMPWVNVTSGTYRVNKRKVVVKNKQKITFTSIDGKTKLEASQLTQIDLFNGVPISILQKIVGMFKEQSYPMGAKIIKEGEPGNIFFLLASGKVEVNQAGPHGEKLVLEVLGAGDHFGEMALFDELPRNANVIALVPTTTLTLNRNQFLKLIKESPSLKENVQESIKNRKLQMASTNEAGEQLTRVVGDYEGEKTILSSYIDYEENPREYSMSVVQSILKVHTRVADLYNDPMNQVEEQMRLMIEEMKERQEFEMINSPSFGLLSQVSSAMRIQPRKGSPTPDDMDHLLSLVWKKPAFFLAHPQAIAAFGRECTRRGVPPPTINLFGSPVITWRGVPIVPSNKLLIGDGMNGQASGTTNILLLRVGEKEQGVVGLHQTGVPHEKFPSLSVRFNGITEEAHACYLMSLYFSCAVLTEDAVGVMENVQVRNYYDY